MDQIQLKRQAGEYAANHFVESGMVVGLGHGSTAIWAVRRIAELIKSGALTDIIAIPCSHEIELDAREWGIPLTDFAHHPVIDVTIDGADEVDPNLQLIKGGGGALLQEKIVAQASKREIIIVDESKLSPALATKFVLPVEVFQFGWRSVVARLEALGAQWTLRTNGNGTPFETDQKNYILDCKFAPIEDPRKLDVALLRLAAVAEHGLFIDIATDVIVAREGGIEHLTANR